MMSSELIYLFFLSAALLFIIRKAALWAGLVDKPNYRKKHKGNIPLVGGIAIYITLCLSFFSGTLNFPHAAVYFICAGLLVFIGMLDDRFDISVKLRIIAQGAIAVVMMAFGHLLLASFGHILGPYELRLGALSVPLTLCAVWAAINAFNMIDGIDGLLGCVSTVFFAACGAVLWQTGQLGLATWSFAIIVALLPYILLNLQLCGARHKVFMGDAGSTLIGFTVIWLLLQTTQGESPTIRPVTALWLIAVPLMDMVSIMYCRWRRGVPVFSPDRQHIHHILIRSGLTARQALVFITFISILLALIGISGERLIQLPEWLMFVLFLLIFSVYGYAIRQVWRAVRFVKRFKRRQRKNREHIVS